MQFNNYNTQKTMKITEKQEEDTAYPNPKPASPGKRPGKPAQQEEDDEDDPLFEEEEPIEEFGDEDEDEYEINDRYSKANLEDIYDYMNSSL